MGLKLGRLRLPWRGSADAIDPNWSWFLDQPVADPRNVAVEIMRRAPEGAVFPTRADLHSPEVTASHLKELARYLGADLVGVVDLASQPPEVAQGYRFAVVCAVRARIDPRMHPGIGGQAAVEQGLYVTFVLSAYMRELGYRATRADGTPAERLAVAAGLGRLNGAGRLVAPGLGTRVHVADPILTDLPLAADG